MAEEDIILCAYEVARLNQIQQNKEFLESLGLEKIKGTVDKPLSESNVEVNQSKLKQRKRKRRGDLQIATRRSVRIANGPAREAGKLRDRSAETDRYRKYKTLVQLQESKGGAKLPPRATYKHTVDRVRSMSEKSLGNRIRAIERANGAYAVLKQRMFAEVLIIEGYTLLAKEAEASYKRLKQLRKS